uniref:Uncharacterized protein n=1 Tax=Clytia hemisphaerica TaxID=252671 RepID=A0A7M5V5E0_9CNID
MAEAFDQIPQADRGYDFDLVKKEQGTNFQCSICHLILRDPYTTPCHHAFCHVCITQWGNELTNAKRPTTCPNCNNVYDQKQIHQDGFIDRMVKTSLDVKCKLHEVGCSWQGKIIDYQDHQRTCEYETIPCENEGCLEMQMRKNLPKHQQICEYRLTQCGYCELKNPIIQMKDHHKECPMMKVICLNEECNVQVLRKDLQRCKMEEHLKENIVEHQLMMLKDYKVTKEKLIETNNDLKQEKLKNEELTAKLETANETMEQLEYRMEFISENSQSIQHGYNVIINAISWLLSEIFQNLSSIPNAQILVNLHVIDLINKRNEFLAGLLANDYESTKVQLETVVAPFKIYDKNYGKFHIHDVVTRRIKPHYLYKTDTGSFIRIELPGVKKVLSIACLDYRKFNGLDRYERKSENVIVGHDKYSVLVFLSEKDLIPEKTKLEIISRTQQGFDPGQSDTLDVHHWRAGKIKITNVLDRKQEGDYLLIFLYTIDEKT